MIIGIYDKEYYGYKGRYYKYKDEVLNSLNQLQEINYGSSLIYSKDFQVIKKPEQVSSLIYKLTKMLENRAVNNHKAIDYDPKILSTINANIDAKYFNHALYNLLDNAIKYGYEGSYIRIKMYVNKIEGRLIVEIISYGIKIEEGDKIYRLFERSDDAAKMSGGTGIGMHIVRKICESHGGNIDHRSIIISEYNIPALICYKHNKKLASSIPEKLSKLNDTVSSLPESIVKEVVCDTSFIKYARVFSASIDEPTYRNIFRISIPL